MNLRKHRQPLASLVLGAWLFALFSTLASACLTDEPGQRASSSGMTMGAQQHQGGHARPVGCEEFCKTDTPLLTKLQLDHDPPAGQLPAIAGSTGVATPVVLSSRLPVSWASPPPQAPLLLRSLRLAL